LSVAPATPSEASTCAGVGLQLCKAGAANIINPGGILSCVHVTVLAAVDVLPQPSLAVNILVCEREQSVLTTDPSLDVIVGSPHASVAVAVPSAAVIALDEGLHPSGTVVNVLVNPGAVTSSVQVTVLAAVDVLPQPSLAVNVLVVNGNNQCSTLIHHLMLLLDHHMHLLRWLYRVLLLWHLMKDCIQVVLL
jgi:hypothetical protein